MSYDISTLGQLREILKKNLASQKPELAAHANTLCGWRTRGSTTKGDLNHPSLSDDLEVVDVTQKFRSVLSDGVRCYQFEAPELEGLVGAISLEQAVLEEMDVQFRMGSHGLELIIDRPYHASEMARCDTITVIVGEFEDEVAIYTWHPGDPLATLSKLTAVKLHNG